MISYSIDTKIGMSGSPLIAFGRLVFGFHKLTLVQGKFCKVGRLITVDMVEKLEEWRQKINGNCFKVNYFKFRS